MKFRFLIFLLSLFFSSLCCAKSAADVPNENAPNTPLVVGMTTGYAPFISLNPKGEYEGFDIDFCKALADKMGKKLIFKDFGSMPSLMLALKQGKADAVVWAISITKERKEKFEMIHYQGSIEDTAPFLFWEQVPSNIKTIADIENYPKNLVTVEAGSSQEDIVKAFPKINIKYTDKIVDAIMDLKYKKCLATTIDPSLLPIYTEKFPQLKVVYLPLPDDLKAYGIGIAIDKSNQTLIEKVRIAVQSLKDEGKIAEFEKKWNLQG